MNYKQLLEELPCPCCGLKKTELARLKELNREMVEVLKEVTSNYYDDYTLPQSVVTHVRQVLQKVKAEVQGE